MTPTLRRCALGLLPLVLVGAVACGGKHAASSGAAHPAASQIAASARAYVNTPAFRAAEAKAKTRTQACAKASPASVTAAVQCAAPKGTLTAVLKCVKDAILGHLFSHPVKAAEAALPACVATQETRAAK
jgi:hypothetical protein